MVNSEIAKILREISILLEMKEVQFKPRAYEKAAHSIEALAEDVKEIYQKGGLKALEDIPGVGKSIAEKIEEYIKTRQVKERVWLKKQFPVDVEGLSSIEGVGPKMIVRFYKELRIKNRDQLEKAIKAGKLKHLEGFGEKTGKNLIRGIEYLKKGQGRFVLGFIFPVVEQIVDRIKRVKGVEIARFAGSIRRMQETVGDLDILVISKKPSEVMDFFVSMPEVESVYSKGPTKSSVRLKIGLDADLRVLPPKSFGAALQYFTGDKYHNVQLRQLAIKKGYKLNEYGLYQGKKLMAGQTEEEIYEQLGLELMPPEIRTNSGEIEAALTGKLPNLIEYDDLRGDLQVQTNWTDGANSIKEMAQAAKKMGLEYICITDHTKSLAMTGGSDEKKLLKQMAAIDEINREFNGSKFKILKGAEVNIMKDGSLDIKDEVLARLDVVGAAVHSNFKLSESEMTARIIKAMENPNVDIIFHPTGRIILKREAYQVNMDEILKAAKRTKTVLEIDAFPDRLDLRDEYIRKAVEMGVKLSIDSDAHSVNHFQYLKYGVAQARRGWCGKEDVINTRSWQEMIELLK